MDAHINDLLGMTVAKNASDLHLKVGGVPVLRINGELVPQPLRNLSGKGRLTS